MLIRLLSGLISPSTGELIYNERVINTYKDLNINIGITIENASLYPNLTGYQNLSFLAEINNRINSCDIIQAMERVGLCPNDKRTVRKYSLGMKQKLAIAQAIMEHPDYLFLDEPTNALDVESVAKVRQIIIEEFHRGTLIILASHNKKDIETLCHKIIYMSDGKIDEIVENSRRV